MKTTELNEFEFEGQTVEQDMRTLICISDKVLKTLPQTHPLRDQLARAIENAAEWTCQDESPQQMGWVGSNGLP